MTKKKVKIPTWEGEHPAMELQYEYYRWVIKTFTNITYYRMLAVSTLVSSAEAVLNSLTPVERRAAAVMEQAIKDRLTATSTA